MVGCTGGYSVTSLGYRRTRGARVFCMWCTATHHDPNVLRGVGLQDKRIMGAGYSLRSWCQRRYGVYQIGDV